MKMIVVIFSFALFVGAQSVCVEGLKHKGGEVTITRLADLDLVVMTHCHDGDEDDKSKEPCKRKD